MNNTQIKQLQRKIPEYIRDANQTFMESWDFHRDIDYKWYPDKKELDVTCECPFTGDLRTVTYRLNNNKLTYKRGA